MNHVPDKLQAILWSTPTKKLDLKKHKTYIIHQVLMYGTFRQIRWLFKTYSKEKILKTFVNQPLKVYTKEAFYYIKNFVLGLKTHRLASDKYVNTIYKSA
jgi:hypothetical protein